MTVGPSVAVPPAGDDELDIRWEVPVIFHSLGVALSEEDRAAHIAEVAAEVWSGGTEFQRSTVADWYREIAAEAAEDGVVYTGFALLGTEDDRVSIATLVVLAEESDTSDPEIAAAALVELLSMDPSHEVFRSDVSCGPAVVSISGMVMDLTEQAGEPTSLSLAQTEVYIPVPGADTLLVCRLSTPSIADFPEYVTMLAQMADTVTYNPSGATAEAAPAATPPNQSRITEAFG
jgi:hypothetical protein